MMSKLVLLTGFLGAGKTTFLNHILEEYEDKKIGLIINEFSQTGIDGALISHSEDVSEMIELNNESVFCACLKDKFAEALAEMAGRNLEYVFIEASGMADPSNIENILAYIKANQGRGYQYLGSICLVDATYFREYLDVLPVLKRQIERCCAAIVNKKDLVSHEDIEMISDIIYEINPQITVYPASYADVSIEKIIQESPVVFGSDDSINTPLTRPITHTLKSREALTADQWKRFLKEIVPSTYRVKGFAKTVGGMVAVNCVGEELDLQESADQINETKQVIFSSVGIRITSVVLQAVSKYFKDKVELQR